MAAERGQLGPVLEALAGALVDPWVCAAGDDRVLRCSDAFAELCPAARSPDATLSTLLRVEGLADASLREACEQRGSVRLESARIDLGGRALTARVGATLVPGQAELFVVVRDLTETLRLEREYAALRERVVVLEHELEERVAARTRELLAANEELNRLERELARLRRGGY